MQSTKWGIVVGAVIGLVLAFLVALLQNNYYLEIMVPGFVFGAIIGFLTQRLGQPRFAEKSRA